MNYIFLVAGRGTRMRPLTTNYPKTLFKLNKHTTIISRMIEMIKLYDNQANIIVVTGFKHEMIQEVITDATLINNPFYSETNSLASLWFAKDYLNEPSIIFNGDVLVEEALMRDVICQPILKPEALLDSSIRNDGDYNVEVIDDRVVVMGKELKTYFGEFVGIMRLDSESIKQLQNEVEIMIQNGQYDQWYEDALIQLIFEDDFSLYYRDVSMYSWTEIDEVSDLLFARNIYKSDLAKND